MGLCIAICRLLEVKTLSRAIAHVKLAWQDVARMGLVSAAIVLCDGGIDEVCLGDMICT